MSRIPVYHPNLLRQVGLQSKLNMMDLRFFAEVKILFFFIEMVKIEHYKVNNAPLSNAKKETYLVLNADHFMCDLSICIF